MDSGTCILWINDIRKTMDVQWKKHCSKLTFLNLADHFLNLASQNICWKKERGQKKEDPQWEHKNFWWNLIEKVKWENQAAFQRGARAC